MKSIVLNDITEGITIWYHKPKNVTYVGKHGFHQVRTMLRFEIDGDAIQNLEVIELGKK